VARQAALLAFLVGSLSLRAPAEGGESWISTISTSSMWAVLSCREHLLSRVCDVEKDFQDPGLLPLVVSIGDVLRYRNRRGEEVAFPVRAINLHVFDRDTEASASSAGVGGRKGETLCSLFDTASRQSIERGYASRVLIKQCRDARK